MSEDSRRSAPAFVCTARDVAAVGPERMRHCEPYNCSHVPCRAYDMAAIKLRGMGKARTNLCKDRYKDEPFMQVPHCHCRC